jgi:peptidoglycan/LPS O-acetylase OafA/YrhL
MNNALGADVRENRALNALRAIAAILVVVGHARAYLFVSRDDAPHDPITQSLLAALSMEHGAVLVFFVLSGYFVGGSSLRMMAARSFGWRKYSLSRLVRLWIVLLPAIGLTLILDLIGRLTLGSSERYSAGSDAVSNTDIGTVLGNVFFLQPIYVDVLGTNRALWSVSYEFAYYAAFPLLLAGVAYARSWLGRIAYLALGVAVLVFFGWSVAALFPVWLLGAFVALYREQIKTFLRKISRIGLTGARIAALALTLAAMVADKIAGGSPSFTPPTSYAVAIAATILTALLITDLHPRFRAADHSLSFVSRLAHSSFSLYAIHLPILSLIAVTISPRNVTGSWQPNLATWGAFLFIVIAIVGCGWLFSLATERHTNRVRRWANEVIPQRASSRKPVAGPTPRQD